jgi:hypothetical protein
MLLKVRILLKPPKNMEGIRPDEDTALKAAGVKSPSEFESLAFRQVYVDYSRVALRLPVKEKGSGQNRLVTPNIAE